MIACLCIQGSNREGPGHFAGAGLPVNLSYFAVGRLAELTDSGKLRPVVSQVFPLREGREAFESGTRPHPPGKTVLLVR